MASISPWTLRLARRTLFDGTLAGMLSTAVLAWRGRAEDGSAAAPIDAPSHWVWGREALRRNEVDVAHTVVGHAVHHASSMLWAAVYAWMRGRRRRPTALNAVSDAALVTALAAVVDLKLTPERFTPGFERRLSRTSLAMVYGSFGAGLALGGWAALARRR